MKSCLHTSATLAAISSCGACLIPEFQPLSASCVFTPGLFQLFPMLPAAYLDF